MLPSRILNHRLALLPSALFVERLLRCQLGVLNLGRVLPSRTRTDTPFSEKSFLGQLRSHPNSAILVLAHSRCRFFALIPWISQRFVYFTGYPQPVQ